MRGKPGLVGVLAAAMMALTGCAQLVIGAGAAVVADEVVENERGGDGLF